MTPLSEEKEGNHIQKPYSRLNKLEEWPAVHETIRICVPVCQYLRHICVACVNSFWISRCQIDNFFFRMRIDPGDYWRALPAVGGFKGSRVRTAAAGLLGHVTVSIPSLRLALISDSYIKILSQPIVKWWGGKEVGEYAEVWEMKNLTLMSSGIWMARRKRPKRSSWVGTASLGARILFPDVSWGKASDCCIMLYAGRLSPERIRCPFEICNDMSFVFIPGTSKTAVRMGSAGLSIKSILWKRVRGERENEYILTYRGVYSVGVDEGATALSLPDFMASMHLRFAARLTAWTNARCRNASKLLWSVILCRELIVVRMRYSRIDLG